MTRILILLFILTTADLFSQNKMVTNPSLFYKQTDFDSDTCCWRKLGSDKKYLEAANLIVIYLKNGKPINRHSLSWHAGQMFASAHSDALAKKYIRQTYSIFYKWFGSTDAKTWYYYAKGTIAFIDKDRKTLELIIKQWSKKYSPDINYEALVTLNDNWGKSYELVTSN